MKHKKSLTIGALMLFIFIGFFSMNTYTSSPGFTSVEGMEAFSANKPICYGIDILLNEKATWADAPGRSLCIGYLKHNTRLTAESIPVIQNQLDSRNRNQDYPIYPNEHTPEIVGRYDGATVKELYWCSDVCPDNGFYYLNIESSTEESCENLGGHKLYKFGWGLQYVGCSPVENRFSE
jgi:hypothetical protein